MGPPTISQNVFTTRSSSSPDFFLNDTVSRQLTVSLVWGVDDSPYQRYREFSLKKFNSRLSVSVMRGVADSAYQWCGDLATPHISSAGSWRIPVSLIRGVSDSPYRWKQGVVFRLRISLRIRSQNRNGSKGTHEEPISAKTPENPPHCHVP